jgi:hypothetical protein
MINNINNSVQSLKLLTTNPILDLNGNNILGISPASSAVNYITITNSIAGNGVNISATGTDASIDLHLSPKSTGAGNGFVYMDSAAALIINGMGLLSMPHYPNVTVDTITNRVVQQQTSITTAVTNNVRFGAIRTATASFIEGQAFYFTLNNTYINANSVIILSPGGIYTTSWQALYYINTGVSNVGVGTCVIAVGNLYLGEVDNIQVLIPFAIY